MGKIRNMHIKTPLIWQCNITQGCILNLTRPLFNPSLTGFAKKFFNRILKKWGFWKSYQILKYSFSVHFIEAITQCTDMIWKILSFFLDFDGANSLITLLKSRFLIPMFHKLPDSYRDWHLIFPVGNFLCTSIFQYSSTEGFLEIFFDWLLCKNSGGKIYRTFSVVEQNHILNFNISSGRM